MKKLLQFFKGIIKKGTSIQKILLVLFVLYIPFSLYLIWEEQGGIMGGVIMNILQRFGMDMMENQWGSIIFMD